jgi:tricorn protease
VYWRKYYRGSFNTDVTVMDLKTKKFVDLTDFEGVDSWPMWGRDGFVYFVSDRDGNGLTNIWRVSEKGGKAEKVTQFAKGDVRFPSISSDGKTIVFEHEFGLWKLEVASRKTSPVKVEIHAEVQENLSEVRSFSSRADDYHLAPNGRRIVFSIHGEVFTAPVEEGDLRQLTDNPARDRDPIWSPDGKQIAFVSDRSGREEIYVTPAEGGDARKLTDLDVLKSALRWSPDSKEIAFTTSENKLFKLAAAGGQPVELASSRYGNLMAPVWSPDGKWLAYAKADAGRTTDIWLVPAAGGQERKATFDSYSEMSPRFSADGKKLYFIRSEGEGQGDPNASRQIYVVLLEKQEKDPDEPEERADGDAPEAGPQGGRRAAQPVAVKEVNIDWDGLKRRTRQVTRMPFPVFGFDAAPDSRTLVFVTSEPGAARSTPVMYSIQDSGKRLTRVTSGGGAEAGADGPGRGPGGGGGFGGGMGGLTIARDGRSVYFMEGGSIYAVTLPAAGGAGGAGPTATSGGGGAARRRVTFTAKVRVNKPAEWAEMFGDAWRTMKYRFYDPKMHGYDWDAMRAKYQPLVEFVGERQELLNLINEMIGELNASHTGAAPAPGSREGGVQSAHLGIELEPDEAAGRYRVAHVYENGPADKDWVKVKAGDYLIAIEGKPVTSSDNYWRFLDNTRLNRKLTVSFNSKPADEGAWQTRIEPVAVSAYSQMRYERWVKQRREMVDKLSGGKLGYLHIQAMDQPSLRKFEKELRENREKPGLVIDQRFNGGGNIEQQLLAILVQREYQIWQPRGTEQTGRPFAGYFGKKIVLQNWRSASNAEMFPAGFRQLGLGKTVGMPTMGAVIGTGSYSLIDGSTVRTPGVGVFLADSKRTNMENLGVKPDVLVENTPEDTLAGKDRQLETAVAELMKEIK